MSIDLSAVPTLTDDLGLYDILLNRDTFPYAQLQAQGRYPDRSTPNTLPEFLATLNASDAGFTPDMLSTDGKRNLNVNIAAGGGGGGGGAVTVTPGNYVNNFNVQDLDFGGALGSDPQHFPVDLSALAAITAIWFGVTAKVASLTVGLPTFRLDFSGGAHVVTYWPVSVLYPSSPPVANGWAQGQVLTTFDPPVSMATLVDDPSTLHARVWGGSAGGTAEILVLGLAA